MISVVIIFPVIRLEEKIQTLKSENQKLYDRYTEVLKSHAEQLHRIQVDAYREISPIQSVLSTRIERLSNRPKPKTLHHPDEFISKTGNAHSTSQITSHFMERFYHLDDSARE